LLTSRLRLLSELLFLGWMDGLVPVLGCWLSISWLVPLGLALVEFDGGRDSDN